MARQGKANVDDQAGLQAVQVRCCQIPERGNAAGRGEARPGAAGHGEARRGTARLFFLLYNRSFWNGQLAGP